MSSASIKIGHVSSIAGSKVSGVLVSPDKPEAVELVANAAQIGSLVKITTPRSIAIGMVSSLTINNPSTPPSPQDQRIIEIDLLGEAMAPDDQGQLNFRRGVSFFPSLGAAILTTTSQELAQIYARPTTSNVRIGKIRQDETLPAYASIDDLLGKNFAVLGNTGTGKSCAVTALLHSILATHPNGHVVLLDPHDEYGRAFGETAERITPETLELPYWLLNFEEVVEALCSREETAREIEAPILKEAIVEAKRDYVATAGKELIITVDTPIPYRLGKMVEHIRVAMGRLNRPERAQPYLRIIARIESLQRDRRFAFMFSGLMAKDTMGDILARILRLPVSGKPITIFPLSGVPSEIVDVVASLLCRLIFDFALWSNAGEVVPVLLVCEEAHRYAPREEEAGFAPTRKAISRIAKEGRKYGVSLGLVTQRPSEISEVILSQCNTLFAMRLSNGKDQEFVMNALPESAVGLLSSLPALGTQQAIVVGEGVNFPMLIRFDDLPLEQRPRSDPFLVSAAWQDDTQSGEFVAATVKRWRSQSR